MKLLRATILFIGLTFFMNGNLSSDQDNLLAKKVEKVNSTNSTDNFDDLVNSFDEAVQKGEAEIFYREISNKGAN